MKTPGQVVLFQFPKSDLAEGKLRPALLLAPVPGPFDDWLICMITTQLRHTVNDFDEMVRSEDDDFADSGLKTDSLIRVGRLAVVDGSILFGAIGQIGNDRFARIRRNIAEWILQADEN